MIEKNGIEKIMAGYDKKNITLATLCSHSSLQIFKGAKDEGFKTLGIRVGEDKYVYDAFPLSKPEEFMVLGEFKEIGEFEKQLTEKNTVLIPHGSLIEFVGERIKDLAVPITGNRKALIWESDRKKMAQWIKKAGLNTPRILKPDEIDVPCIVKLPGAKGGKGYFTVKDTAEFEEKIVKMKISEETLKRIFIQEYMVGIRFYPHFFYSPLEKDGYRVGEGRLELLGMDRRVETNIDEIYRANAFRLFREPSFAVVGNESVVARESLLDKILTIGKNTVEASVKLFGGIPGPFCVEMICDEDFNFHVFEISSRIVAGTNLYPEGSPYSQYVFEEHMSMGRRIAREVKTAVKQDALEKIIY